MTKLNQFLLQMAGTSGVGKSTIAQWIASQTGAVIVDMDVIKSAALEAGTTWDMSGRVSYRASHALADSLLTQGFSVILDSPCRFDFIVAGGTTLAAKHKIPYAFIECVLSDQDELRHRMLNRKRQRSQRLAPDQAPADAMVDETGNVILHKTKYPKSPWLQVNTSEPMQQILEKSLVYLKNINVSG